MYGFVLKNKRFFKKCKLKEFFKLIITYYFILPIKIVFKLDKKKMLRLFELRNN